MDFKQQVEDFLKYDRTQIGGINLYNRLPGKSKAMQLAFSRFPTTPENLDKICFHLCNLVGIPERNRKILMQKPVVEASASVEVEAEKVTSSPTDEEEGLIIFDPKTAKYQDAKKLSAALGLKPKSQKKDDIFAALSKARAELVKKK